MGFFKKVSYEQFEKDMIAQFGHSNFENDRKLIKKIWENLQPPKRSTVGSAGYDFKAPFNFSLIQGGSIIIPTGYRCFLNSDEVLLIYPRSGQGFKHRLSICNTVGVIDSDYTEADNEGHVMIKLVYDGVSRPIYNPNTTYSTRSDGTVTIDNYDTDRTYKNSIVNINSGDGFAQGIITIYRLTNDDAIKEWEKRKGGFGSTDKK